MLPKIADMVEHMKLGSVDYLPDIFAISSEGLVEMLSQKLSMLGKMKRNSSRLIRRKTS